jgi:hypothetical protein
LTCFGRMIVNISFMVGPTYKPASPVRTVNAPSTGVIKILPSPKLPV